ncbi:MAG: ABC transporter permease [Ichthyobacteriaceae bacterium]|nr:ABC transporter permease [Ichthyobacteriaceae bacterium]
MNTIALIIKREYLTKVRRRAFIVMTFLGPLLFVAVLGIIAFLANVNKEEKTVAIYDETSLFINTFTNTEDIKYVYLPTDGLTKAIKTAEKNNYTGIVYVPFKNSDKLVEIGNSIEFLSNSTPSITSVSTITSKIKERIKNLKLIEFGTSEDLVDKANVPVNIRYVNYSGEVKNSKLNVVQFAIGAFLGVLIYMFILVYGVQVMRSVMEEKTNRIIEVIISSVKPFKLMLGKIIGTALVGLTQYLLWFILSSVLLTVTKRTMNINSPNDELLSNISSSQGVDSNLHQVILSLFELNYVEIFSLFLFFFLGGYLLYSALFAAVGAAVDSETDTQQFMLPITLPLIIGIYTALMILDNPHGPVAFWMSMIPFTSPVVMMARVPFDVPTWQILLSMIILVISFILTTFMAAKIYRVGVLMYGKKVTYKELWKWVSRKE